MKCDLLTQTLDALLSDHATFDVREAAGEGIWPEQLWSALEAAYMTSIGVPEDAGGAGGTFRDVTTLATQCGFHAAPGPLVDTALAGWALTANGSEPPGGPVGVVQIVRGARTAPWARCGVSLLTEEDGRLSLFPPSSVAVLDQRIVAGEPDDVVQFTGPPDWTSPRTTAGPAQELRARAAVTRAAMLAGACVRVLDLSLVHARTREQFGRPLVRFQAVGHQLAVMAGEAATARAAIDAAAHALESAPNAPRTQVLCEAARLRAAMSATRVCQIGHQVHGALGTTGEHQLHHFTRRLLAWRDSGGTEFSWATRLGARVDRMDEQAIWAGTF